MFNLLHFILYCIYIALFIFIISKWKFFEIEGTKRKQFVVFFCLKVIAGLALTSVYTWYYTDASKADIYRYFNDSKVISAILFADPVAWLKLMLGFDIDNNTFSHIANTQYFSHPVSDLVTSNSLFIRVVSLLNYCSACNIFIDTLLLNFITFIGLTALYKAMLGCFKGHEKILFIPIYLLPSVVFWSAGLLKESVLLPAIGLYIYAFTLQIEKPGLRAATIKIAGLAIGFAVVLLVKLHVAAFLLLCSPLLPAPGRFRRFTAIVVSIYLGLVLFFSYTAHQNPCSIIIEKRNEFTRLIVAENAGSALDTTLQAPDCAHIFKLLPSSFINAVLRPFIWNRGNLLQLIFAIENLFFLLTAFALPIFFFKKPNAAFLSLSCFFLLFALFNYFIIGLTVPVMGAIVHYRVVAMPFLLLGLMCWVDLERLSDLKKS